MGMFDSVWVHCPECGKEIEFQSKTGSCIGDYTLDTAPADVISSMNGEVELCSACDASVLLTVQVSATVSTL